MAKPACALNTNERNKLEGFILSPEADKFGMPQAERKKILSEYLERTKSSRSQDGQRGIPLSELPSFLSMFNMTIKDAYDVWGNPLAWPSDEAKRAADIMDTLGMNPQTVQCAEQLCEIAHSMMSEEWDVADQLYPDTPSSRILRIYLQFMTARERRELLKKLPESFTSPLSEQSVYVAINTVDLATMCKYLGAPYHWCAGFAPEILCIGKTPYTERFMDMFLRLPREYKMNLLMSLEFVLAATQKEVP